MSPPAIDPIDDAATRFAIADAWNLSPRAQFAPLGRGLINATLRVRDRDSDFVLQRLNAEVFRDPALVMRNFRAVTSHLARQRAIGRYSYSVLELLPTRFGESALILGDGSCWRLCAYLPGTRSHETADDPAVAREAGHAFGAFAHALDALPAAAIGEVIAGFHDPASRMAAFERARLSDRIGRAAACTAECAAAARFADVVDEWQHLDAAGLPRRFVHNDCKLNNVLFDTDDRAICVIDLDTVMPGSLLFDFGDLVRTLVSPVAEDSIELDRVHVRRDVFAALAAGYVGGCGPLLSAIEREHLVFGARLMTGAIAVRFLTDYLDGDTYFRIERPLHNLERARNQIALLAALSDAADELQMLVPAPLGGA